MNINLGFMKGVLFYGVFGWIYSGKKCQAPRKTLLISTRKNTDLKQLFFQPLK